MADTDSLYEALSGMIAALKVLQTALEGEREQGRPAASLQVVAGQGRGSRKSPAKLKSVEIRPESRKA